MKKNKSNKTIVATGCSFVVGAELELGNSFIDLLGGINLGQEASGNTGAVNRILMANIPKNSTVIFMLSGMNRMDFFDKNHTTGSRFVPTFPSSTPVNIHGQDIADLEKSLSKFSSNITEVYYAIVNIVNMQNFCKANNHKLIMFSAFTKEYNKEYFYKTINDDFVNCVDWDKFLIIDGCSNFFDWTVKQSGSNVKLSMMEMQVSAQRPSELEGWIMPRLHPSKKAHKLFSERLCEFL